MLSRPTPQSVPLFKLSANLATQRAAIWSWSGARLRGRLRTAHGDCRPTCVRLKSDVIVAVGRRRMIPAVKASTTIPIILVPSYFDPVRNGVVETLARNPEKKRNGPR